MDWTKDVSGKEHIPDQEIGLCCCCQKEEADHIIMLNYSLPSYYRPNGWSCKICRIKGEGAMAVACTGCVIEENEIKEFVAGAVEDMERAPISKLKIPLYHSEKLHKQSEKQMEAFGYIFPGSKKAKAFNYTKRLFSGVALETETDKWGSVLTFIDMAVNLSDMDAVYEAITLLRAEVLEIYDQVAFIRPHGATATALIEQGYLRHMLPYKDMSAEGYLKPITKPNK